MILIDFFKSFAIFKLLLFSHSIHFLNLENNLHANPINNPIENSVFISEQKSKYYALNNQQQLSQLRELLEAKQWQEADEKTWELIKRIGDRDNSEGLDNREMKNFSCSTLRQINDLWLNSSEEHFGFSVQKEIYISVGGKPGIWDYNAYRRYAVKVGWKEGTDKDSSGYKNFENMTFSLDAPRGHLPVKFWADKKSFAEFRGGMENFTHTTKNFLTRCHL